MAGPLPSLREERDRQVKPGDDIPTLRECQRIPPCATPGVQNPPSMGNPALREEETIPTQSWDTGRVMSRS